MDNLDQKPQSCSNDIGKHACQFAEWLQENRWLSFEQGKWNYVFEHGTSVSNTLYNKNYKKTTEELYAKFCQEYGY